MQETEFKAFELQSGQGKVQFMDVQTPLLTPRLEIVAPDVALAQLLADALNASYETHRLFLVWSRPRWELTDTLDTLQRAQSDFVRHDAEKKFFLLTREHPQQLVGCIGFTPKADGSHEIGYWANQSFQGRGLMREALTALIAQLPGARLYLTTSSANAASRRLAESVGFRLVRTLVGDRRSDAFGGCDTLVFKRGAADWLRESSCAADDCSCR
ncbi:hypothetical protein AHFPHNDE_02392 [Pseudomonas sp. MM227]|uniref:GNAT family N-acetyltransferase n=1 Tax=Pseudomonas sp. MM227 TaxID=3019968 RepID=UPI00221F54BC|nr:GNAT family protein [Pseudomonas sp. MM227]CAI3788715.1 hypothetical protein AHFPHNDE_02392 [Pseudomonas sp. MM227]